MHNINVAIQIVSAQKNAYARTLSYECVRSREKYESVLPLWCAFNNALKHG